MKARGLDSSLRLDPLIIRSSKSNPFWTFNFVEVLKISSAVNLFTSNMNLAGPANKSHKPLECSHQKSVGF